jgi:hypothetical protein
MRVGIRRWRQSRCRHQVTITAVSVGMERDVCESCGHVAFRYMDAEHTSGAAVDREAFGRPGDVIEEWPPGRHEAET